MLSLDSRYLARVRLEALRRRIWFKALSSLERGLVDFVIRVVDRPRSLKLIEALARIIVKVKKAMISPLRWLMEQVGRPLARRISIVALRWGNRSAVEWAEDEGFIKYLTIMDINNISGFRLSSPSIRLQQPLHPNR
ncbi:MAG: hypothetical protein QXN21_05770 [Candidatus Bathyarchaeia archaeon]